MPTLAAQLYTVRDFTKTADDFAASIKKVADIGYTAAQVSAIGPIPHGEVKQLMDDHGLKICNTHIGYDLLWNDIDAVIDQHKLWECEHVAIGSLPPAYREEGEAGYMRFAKEASAVGEKLHAAGLTFSYHNHSFEFIRFLPTMAAAAPRSTLFTMRAIRASYKQKSTPFGYSTAVVTQFPGSWQ